jgi:hypothetical protein
MVDDPKRSNQPPIIGIRALRNQFGGHVIKKAEKK